MSTRILVHCPQCLSYPTTFHLLHINIHFQNWKYSNLQVYVVVSWLATYSLTSSFDCVANCISVDIYPNLHGCILKRHPMQLTQLVASTAMCLDKTLEGENFCRLV